MDAFYDSPEWRELRARILERDGSRCLLARFVGGRCSGTLHVHHIEPLSERWDLRLAEENLVTACAGHHPVLEAFRRFISARRRPLPPCNHRHPYPQGRIDCERRRARELGIDLEQLEFAA